MSGTRHRLISLLLLAGACLVPAACSTGEDGAVTPAATGHGAEQPPAEGAGAERPRDRPPAGTADAAVHRIRGGHGTRVPIESRGGVLHVTIRWSDDGRVSLGLITPDGGRIDGPGAGVTHERGPTFESFHVHRAEAGTWIARLTNDGPAEVTPVRLVVHHGTPDRDRAALVIHQETRGAVVALEVDAGPGEVAAYLWEFGDGSTSRDGPRVSHTYRRPGEYRVSVAVQDPDGRWRVATAEEPVDVP